VASGFSGCFGCCAWVFGCWSGASHEPRGLGPRATRSELRAPREPVPRRSRRVVSTFSGRATRRPERRHPATDSSERADFLDDSLVTHQRVTPFERARKLFRREPARAPFDAHAAFTHVDFATRARPSASGRPRNDRPRRGLLCSDGNLLSHLRANVAVREADVAVHEPTRPSEADAQPTSFDSQLANAGSSTRAASTPSPWTRRYARTSGSTPTSSSSSAIVRSPSTSRNAASSVRTIA